MRGADDDGHTSGLPARGGRPQHFGQARPAPAPDPGADCRCWRYRPHRIGRFALRIASPRAAWARIGFVWSLRRPRILAKRTIFVAEDLKERGPLLPLGARGARVRRGSNTSSQLIALEWLRQEAREAGRSDPGRAHNLSPAQPCQMTTNRQPCLLYQLRGVTIDGKPALSTHGWSASRREDGSVLFFHVAWAGYAGPHRAEHRKTLAKVDKQVRSLLDASYVIDASGRRLVQ